MSDLHEVAAVFVGDKHGKYLFFERVKFPFGLTVPAGHIEPGEAPALAAVRELREETGIIDVQIRSLAVDDISEDICRRGHQGHRWHSFIATSSRPLHVKVNDEGKDPVWLTPGQALRRNLTIATRHVLTHHLDTVR